MNILKTAFDIERLNRLLVWVTPVVVALSLASLHFRDALALTSGFIMFSLNMWALTYLLGMVFSIVAYSGTSVRKSSKYIAVFVGLAKCMVLFFALFLILVKWQLSGWYLFLGSLIAMVILCGWMSFRYLNYLSEIAQQREKERISLLPVSEPEDDASYKSIIRNDKPHFNVRSLSRD